MVINQGDIFWITLGEPAGSSPGYRHPHVVIQNNLFNQSRINTAVVCTLTTNLKRAAAPGNVLLDSDEGGRRGLVLDKCRRSASSLTGRAIANERKDEAIRARTRGRSRAVPARPGQRDRDRA